MNGISISVRIAQGLMKIGLAMKANEWKESAKLQLSPTQAQVLAALGTRGPLRLSELAALLAITLATASDAVSILVKKGLVEKRTSKQDARALSIVLTRTGQKAAKAVAAWPDFLVTAVDTLSPNEQVTFHRGLVKMIGTLQKRGQIPVARMCAHCTYFRPNVHAGSHAPHHCDFIDSAFGDGFIRIDCDDFVAATTSEGWDAWVSRGSATQ